MSTPVRRSTTTGRPARRGLPALALPAAVIISITLAACGGGGTSAQESGPVKVAALYPLSGTMAGQGQDSLHGAQLAAEIVNGDHRDIVLDLAPGLGLPRLGGRTVEVTSIDTQGDPQKGAAAVDQAVTGGGAVALLGAYQSAVTKAASQRAEQLGTPFVNGESSSVELTERGLTWFFRTGPSDETFARTFFDFVNSQKRAGRTIQRVAIIHGDEEYGNSGATITKRFAEERGYEVVADVSYAATATSLAPQVQQLRAAEPDVVFVLSYTGPAQRLVSTLKQLNWYPSALLAYGAGFTDPVFLKAAGANAEGMMTRTSWSQEIAQGRPVTKAVADLFQQRFKAPMTENSARSFTAALTMFQAIDRAGSTDPAAIRTALEKTNILGDRTIMPWEGILFDSKHQNISARGIVEQLQSGSYRIVFPADISTVDVIWPLKATISR